MNKKEFIISGSLILIIIILLIMGLYFKNYEKSENDNNIKTDNDKIIVKSDNKVEFLSEVKISDLIESIEGTIIEDNLIDTTILGKQTIEFLYKNLKGKKKKGNFEIEIVDTVPPVIWLSTSYTITVGNNVNLAKKIMCGDNYDSHPKCEVLGEYDYNKVGVYPLTFKATDNSGNTSEINFKLNVIESKSNNNANNTKTHFEDVVKKYKNENTKIGLDISEWQDYPDFNKLKNAGVEFIFLRVGGTKLSTGDYFLDKSFKYNIEEANKVGIPVGVYFYSYAKNKDQAIKDAEWIYEQIKDYKVDLGVAYDWENWSFYNDFGLSFYELTEMANNYLNYFKEKGYQGLLYSSKSYLEEIWLKTDFPVWLAHYTKNLEQSSYKGEYSYWQLCSDGRVDGINGAVDINIGYIK